MSLLRRRERGTGGARAGRSGMRGPTRFVLCALFATGLFASFYGCRLQQTSDASRRRGDEIVACGQMFHTGTPVVLWNDPGAYNAYQGVAHVNSRDALLSPDELARLRARGGVWELPLLQSKVDQFVLHYDACGLSKICFKVLQERNLSVHFMLDVDGTIYQTMDLRERAWHATTSNSRSIGIEIANIGAFPSPKMPQIARWYQRGGSGKTMINPPVMEGGNGIRTPGFVGHPARNEPVVGQIQGQTMYQYDLTPQQYEALGKLTAALTKVFPHIRLEYPRDSSGRPITHKLPDAQLERYTGLIGHYHIQENKQDPGPAFQWELVVERARRAR